MSHSIPKRILIFSTAYYPFVGGAEIAIREITDRLGKGFECDLITARFDRTLPLVEKIGAVTVYRIGFGKPLLDKVLLPFWGAWRAMQLEEKHHYFCFWGVMATFGSGAGYVYNLWRQITRKKKIPMVLNLQEGDSETHLNYKWGGLIHLSWKLALKQTDILTALSTFLLHRAERMGYRGRSVLVPNGVNIKMFTRRITKAEKEEARLLLEKKEGDVFLVTTSRLTHKNAVDDIISSLTHLPEDISLIVIGRGEEGSMLEAHARKCGVSSRVKFMGFIPQERMPLFFSACDIFVRPSRSEGFGNSFIEAMASRLPVIATPVGGIPDFIDDQETGLFCAPDNPKSIAGAVLRMLENDALREKIIAQAYERVVARYSWEYIAHEMKEKVFNTIM